MNGDVWDPPRIRKYENKQGNYLLIVYPTSIPENYSKKNRKNKDSITHCFGKYYRIDNVNDTVHLWTRKLNNRIAPQDVKITKDGRFIVSVDNWSSLGSDDFITIYSFSGEIIAKFQLDKISPFKIDDYERTVSSIWWGSASLDKEEKWLNLYFRTEKNKSEIRRFNLKELRFDEEMDQKEE